MSDRLALGQVYTPAPVADLALALALEDLPATGDVLDPACGDGVFLARAHAAGVPAGRLRGIDVDASAAAAARARVPGARVEIGDFLDGEQGQVAAVVGNPPYVRQERVGPAGKAKIRAALARDWPELAPAVQARFAGRADLALAFLARALRVVVPGGKVVFVVSAALVDSDYARLIDELLAGRGHIAAIVGSPRERWFADAAVHGVILVVEKRPGPPGVVARLAAPVAGLGVRGMADLARVADLRPLAPGRSAGALLRAPDAWFAREALGGLVRLGELADIRRGATSGANEFFYPPADAGIEPELLLPLLKTPRHASRILVDTDALPTRAFVCSGEPPPGAARWIARHAHLASRPTLRVRRPWWSLSVKLARLFLTKAYHARFVQQVTTHPVIADQRVYALAPASGVDEELLGAALNGTLTALALESLGRASMGEGALEWSVADAAQLPVIDVRRLDARAARAVRAAFAPLARRPAGDVFGETGREDRRRLDRALAAACPGSEEMIDEVAEGLVSAVEERLARSRATSSCA